MRVFEFCGYWDQGRDRDKFEKRREKFKKKNKHIRQVQECPEEIFRKSAGETRPEQEKCTQRKQLHGALHRSVSPGDSMEEDKAGVCRARVGVNVITDEKKHENEKQQ